MRKRFHIDDDTISKELYRTTGWLTQHGYANAESSVLLPSATLIRYLLLSMENSMDLGAADFEFIAKAGEALRSGPEKIYSDSKIAATHAMFGLLAKLPAQPSELELCRGFATTGYFGPAAMCVLRVHSRNMASKKWPGFFPEQYKPRLFWALDWLKQSPWQCEQAIPELADETFLACFRTSAMIGSEVRYASILVLHAFRLLFDHEYATHHAAMPGHDSWLSGLRSVFNSAFTSHSHASQPPVIGPNFDAAAAYAFAELQAAPSRIALDVARHAGWDKAADVLTSFRLSEVVTKGVAAPPAPAMRQRRNSI